MPYGRKTAQVRVSQTWSTLAPVGGINDTDPLAAMGPEYCIKLRNWYPGNAALTVRVGYQEWVTGLEKPVKTLMPYFDMGGQLNLFAATDDGIYDVTTSADSPPVAHPTGDGYYKFAMFGAKEGGNQYLVAVNGATEPSCLFDGSTWTNFTEAGTEAEANAPGKVFGVDPATFSHVAAFKHRLWFVQAGSTTAWYLPPDALGGKATAFYVGGLFRLGGRLLAIVGWSYDGGNGLDDKLVFISDVGEIVVFSGDNPDDADNWSLQAVLYLSKPLGERCFAEVGGDVMITTKYGIVSLTRALMSAVGTQENEDTISKRINRTLNQLVQSKKYGEAWELYNLQAMQSLALTVKDNGINNPPIQYVMNLLTGAWTLYDFPIQTMVACKDVIYFGTADGRVMFLTQGQYKDNVNRDGSGGVPIQCEIFTAFSYMGEPTLLKHWKLFRPIFQSVQKPNFAMRLNTDFAIQSLSITPAPPPPEDLGLSLWDHAIWDQSKWAAQDEVFRPWVGVSALGFCAALLMKINTTSRISLTAMEYVFEPGGIV